MVMCSWPLCSRRIDAKQAELFGAVEQAFDGGGRPAGSAPRGSLVHGFELRADLLERQIGIGSGDAGDQGEETLAARLARGGAEQGRIGQPFGDEAVDDAFQLLDAPARRGAAIGPITFGVEDADDVLPAMIGPHLPHDRQPMLGGMVDAVEVVPASSLGNASNGVGIAGAQFGAARHVWTPPSLQEVF